MILPSIGVKMMFIPLLIGFGVGSLVGSAIGSARARLQLKSQMVQAASEVVTMVAAAWTKKQETKGGCRGK